MKHRRRWPVLIHRSSGSQGRVEVESNGLRVACLDALSVMLEYIRNSVGREGAIQPLCSAFGRRVARCAKMSQTELARWAKVEQPTMAQMLARMERDGIIHREPDSADRRGSFVSLTKKALSRLPDGRAVLERGNADMTQGLSEREVETLIGLLRRVLANVEDIEANPPAQLPSSKARR